MQIQIRGGDTELTEALRSHIERHLRFALSRFGERVARASVRLEHVAGPPVGPRTWCCSIDVTLRPASSVIVDEKQDDLHTAIDRATERVGRAVSREIERLLEGTAARRHRSKP